MSYVSPDPASLDYYGEDFTFEPNASGGDLHTVKLMPEDEGYDGERVPSNFVILFGTWIDSGFTDPVPEATKGDFFHRDGVRFRITRIETDWAGGSQATAGRWFYCERVN